MSRVAILPNPHTLKNEDWREYANCRGMDTERFFPPMDGTPDNEVQIKCRDCPVRAACLDYAQQTGSSGYWGGTTQRYRNTLYSGRPRTKCPACFNKKTVELAHLSVCNLCGTSW